MARLARGEYLDPRTIQIVHTVQRFVRRAFLCDLFRSMPLSSFLGHQKSLCQFHGQVVSVGPLVTPEFVSPMRRNGGKMHS